METVHIETTISSEGTLIIRGLPFQPGDEVEVTIRSRKTGQKRHTKYPLRGKPLRYVDPFDSVAENDWELLK